MTLFLEKISNKLARMLFWVAGLSIIIMMLLTCADVALRFFRMPIPGTYELVCFMGSVAVAFAIAHTSALKGHVAVSVVINLLPKRFQLLLECITNGLGFILFLLISWQSVLYADTLRSTGEVSLTLQLPFYPFVYGIGLSAAAVCLLLLADLNRNLLTMFDK